MGSREYYVYIVTNRRGTLYTGMSNDLEHRPSDHEQGRSHFTSRYRIWKLLFVQSFADVNEAIAAEKRIKGWTRAKKLALIRRHNPTCRSVLCVPMRRGARIVVLGEQTLRPSG